jgi:hypothetical protein
MKIESTINATGKLAQLNDPEKQSELMQALNKIDVQKVITLSNLIVSSIELDSGRRQINIKSGIFEELD